MKILETILTSTVLLGLITALFKYIKDKKDVEVEYITKERAKWRDDI